MRDLEMRYPCPSHVFTEYDGGNLVPGFGIAQRRTTFPNVEAWACRVRSEFAKQAFNAGVSCPLIEILTHKWVALR